jgi:hypothetical protein
MRKWFLLVVLVLCAAPAFAQSSCTVQFQDESVPPFYLGQPANYQFQGLSGTPPYKFEVFDGVLPEGLTLHKNGKVTGVPREEDSINGRIVYVTITDAAGCSLTQAYYFFVFVP